MTINEMIDKLQELAKLPQTRMGESDVTVAVAGGFIDVEDVKVVDEFADFIAIHTGKESL